MLVGASAICPEITGGHPVYPQDAGARTLQTSFLPCQWPVLGLCQDLRETARKSEEWEGPAPSCLLALPVGITPLCGSPAAGPSRLDS